MESEAGSKEATSRLSVKVGDLVRVKDPVFEEFSELGVVTMIDGGVSKFDGQPWTSYRVMWTHRDGQDEIWHEKHELELVSEGR